MRVRRNKYKQSYFQQNTILLNLLHYFIDSRDDNLPTQEKRYHSRDRNHTWEGHELETTISLDMLSIH